MQIRKRSIQLLALSAMALTTFAIVPLHSQSEVLRSDSLLIKQVDAEAQILQSFMAKKSLVEQFFSMPQALAEIQEDSRTTSGISVYMRRIHGIVSDFDLERSESLVNPYNGYVSVTYREEKCGLTPEPSSDYASSDFVTEEDALSVLESCPYWQEDNGQDYDRQLVFLFEYSESNWQLTGIDRYSRGRKVATDPGLDLAFYPGIPPTRSRRSVTNEMLIQHNSKWSDLVDSLLN